MTTTLQNFESQAIGIAKLATPFLPPNISLALTLITGLANAVQSASTAGVDITSAQLAALFTLDDQAKAADLAAQAAAGAKP